MDGIDTKEALSLLKLEGAEVYELFTRANAVRLENKGLEVRLCGVVNAKSGMCTEDCKFCAQSAHNDSNVECFSLMKSPGILDEARQSQADRATRFGIVTSGLALENEEELETVLTSVRQMAKTMDILPCASLGNVSRQTLGKLKEAGLTRYHCNLETAESFYPEICTTRPWSDSVDTIRSAMDAGLATCSGGLFGLGESLEQRVELLASIRDLGVDSVPINFFNPVPGTNLSHVKPPTPIECLKIIAVARLMMPNKEIRVCGGREHSLGDLQSWSLICGADGLMVGGYLTTKGRAVEDDLKMIADAGFKVVNTEGGCGGDLG